MCFVELCTLLWTMVPQQETHGFCHVCLAMCHAVSCFVESKTARINFDAHLAYEVRHESMLAARKERSLEKSGQLYQMKIVMAMYCSPVA